MKSFFTDDLILKLFIACVLIFKNEITSEEIHMEPILTTILTFFFEFAKNWPFTATLIAVMGSFRLFFKPVMTMIQSVVAATSTKKDDEVLNKVETSMAYKALMFVVDYIASIKLPK